MLQSQQPASAKLIRKRPVCELCGGISRSTLERWIKAPPVNVATGVQFPAPIKLGGSIFWREHEVLEFLNGAPKTAASQTDEAA